MPFPPSPVYGCLLCRRADAQLKIVVVGGKLSGLTAAYNLRQAGHDVHVLERSSKDLPFSAGVRVPPNMAKLLQQWGIGEKLKERSTTCPKVEFLDDTTGERLSSIVYHKKLMKELRADVYNVPYADLYDMIRDLALRSGVKIDYDTTVVDVDVDAPSVLLEQGGTIEADLIVGAEGTRSIVRERLVGRKDDHEVLPHSGYHYMIPVSKMEQDPLLAPLLKDGTWSLWCGDNRCLLGYRAGLDGFAVAVVVPKTSTNPAWTGTTPISQINYADAEERIKHLLSLGDQVIEVQYIKQESLDRWFSPSGKVVLIGNSVHVTNPSSMNEAALSVEDGAVLGSLLSRLGTKSQDEIIRLLSAYQEIRQERFFTIQKTDVELLTFSMLPPGPAREDRNAGFMKTATKQMIDWENVDEDTLRSTWEEFRSSFGYEAYDAADDWWVDWGVMLQRIAAGEDIEVNGSSSGGAQSSFLDGMLARTVVSTSEE